MLISMIKMMIVVKIGIFYGFLLFLYRHAFKIHSNVFDKGIDTETKVTTLDEK